MTRPPRHTPAHDPLPRAPDPASPAAADNPWRRDWDERARRSMRLYVATWYARSDETWHEGTRRDAVYLMERLPPELGPGQACLDVGCGPGRLLPYLAQRFERVVGCDVSPEMLRHAAELVGGQPRAVGARIELRLTDGRTLAGLRDGAFSFVLANAVFIHLDRPLVSELLGEVSRVLAPGGLFAGTFNVEAPAAAEAPAAERPVADRAAPASRSDAAAPATAERAPESPPSLPPPEVTAEEIALIGGPTWDGARYTREQVLQLLYGAALAPATRADGLQQQGTSWNVLARKRSG